MNDGFLGGPPRLFEAAGREQLIVLLEHGLCFDSFVLDVGCGALRGGRWVIPLLDPGHYCGIEPNRAMLERGLREFLDPEVVECKRPRFDGNDRFDFSVFGIRFTHVVARSVWTHASKQQIGAMLDGFAAHSASDGVFLASFLPAGESKAQEDYLGEAWVGRSHESDEPGMVGHAWRWVEEECAARGLEAQRLDRAPLTERGQVWCVVRHA
ncbi:MAG: class I SAM-dependent methyltransferase [Actinobacteria bacterium]|nr:class I SAM-dependent methyltransferase [Actinomycetota bacterium]